MARKVKLVNKGRPRFKDWNWDLNFESEPLVRKICSQAARVVLDQVREDLGTSNLEPTKDGWVIHFYLLKDEEDPHGDVACELFLSELLTDAISDWYCDHSELDQLRAELVKAIKLIDSMVRPPQKLEPVA